MNGWRSLGPREVVERAPTESNRTLRTRVHGEWRKLCTGLEDAWGSQDLQPADPGGLAGPHRGRGGFEVAGSAYPMRTQQATSYADCRNRPFRTALRPLYSVFAHESTCAIQGRVRDEGPTTGSSTRAAKLDSHRLCPHGPVHVSHDSLGGASGSEVGDAGLEISLKGCGTAAGRAELGTPSSAHPERTPPAGTRGSEPRSVGGRIGGCLPRRAPR